MDSIGVYTRPYSGDRARRRHTRRGAHARSILRFLLGVWRGGASGSGQAALGHALGHSRWRGWPQEAARRRGSSVVRGVAGGRVHKLTLVFVRVRVLVRVRDFVAVRV